MLKGSFVILSESGLLSRINGHIQYAMSKIDAIMFDSYRKAELFKAQNRKLIGSGRIVEIY